MFNSNCASCHSLDKKLTGPALRNTDSLQLFHWLTNSNVKIDSTSLNEFKINYHKITWGNKLPKREIKQLFQYCKN
ncbi:cytochrome c [Flavobacterium jejuense]|uniref:Cytochrome c n=1 Tax=Flavobacterium jejuense TaxID=1544455 RepID=A0ABX0IS61_9FLAO|nr:cytochrome c [Flavobacterium jejuense]